MRLQKRDNTLSIVLAILLAYITFAMVQSMVHNPLEDMNGHTYVYIPMMMNKWAEGWMAAPYCMWHLIVILLHRFLYIPLDFSAGYACAFFCILSFFVIRWMVLCYAEYLNAKMNSDKAAIIAFGLSIVQPIYISWFDAGDDYWGAFSMNPLHNPTQMCMRPFALICVCLVYDIWNLHRDEKYEGVFFRTSVGIRRLYLYLAIALWLSAVAKPTFAEMFIPTVAIIMLVRLIIHIVKRESNAGEYFKQCISMLVCAVPSLVYILIAFFAYFIFGGSYGGGEGLVITAFLEVWGMFTENVALSIFLGMTFPLSLFLIDSTFYLKNDLGMMGLVGYVIGFLEAAFLGEGGEKLSHGDFLWPMMAGMMLMFIVAVLHLIELTAKYDNHEMGVVGGDRKYYARVYLLDFARAMLLLQAFAGVIFIVKAIWA